MGNAQSSNTAPINVSSGCTVTCVATIAGEKCYDSCLNQQVPQTQITQTQITQTQESSE